MVRQALGPAPEADFPVNRATGPGSPMDTTPSSARGTLLAVFASESSSDSCKKPDFGTFLTGAAARAFKGKSQWLQLPVVPPFPPYRDVIDPPNLPAGKYVDNRGGGRGDEVYPRLLLRERGSRGSKHAFMIALFDHPKSSQHVVD